MFTLRPIGAWCDSAESYTFRWARVSGVEGTLISSNLTSGKSGYFIYIQCQVILFMGLNSCEIKASAPLLLINTLAPNDSNRCQLYHVFLICHARAKYFTWARTSFNKSRLR